MMYCENLPRLNLCPKCLCHKCRCEETRAIGTAGSGETIPPLRAKHYTFGSGAVRSEKLPEYGRCAMAILPLLADRYAHGHVKYESSEIYANANWRKALVNRDAGFFRQAFAHAINHLIAESQGKIEETPGGNLGAVAWGIDVLAEVRRTDPELYKAAIGLAEFPALPKTVPPGRATMDTMKECYIDRLVDTLCKPEVYPLPEYNPPEDL